MTLELSRRRVLVTGADGFIGSHLVRQLLAATSASEVHATYFRQQGDLSSLDLACHPLDLRDLAAIDRVVDAIRPDIVFNLGAAVDLRRDLERMTELFEVNARAPIHLARACARHGFERFLQVGTCEEYGDGQAPFHEDDPPRPVSPYSASKVASSYGLQMLHRSFGLPITVVRPFLTYGPRQRPSMLMATLIEAGLRGEAVPMTRGTQTREFNFVDDIVDGLLLAAQKRPAVGEIINLGGGEERSVRSVAELLVELFEGRLKIELGALPQRPGEAQRFFGTHDKARHLLGFQPQVGLREGLARTIAYRRRTRS